MQRNFTDEVYKLVEQIPPGRVMSYGQVAALCGNPRAARIVGGVAHFGPDDLPWHRLVNIKGGLASGFYGGREAQAKLLENEGVSIDDGFYIDIDKYLWWP